MLLCSLWLYKHHPHADVFQVHFFSPDLPLTLRPLLRQCLPPTPISQLGPYLSHRRAIPYPAWLN